MAVPRKGTRRIAVNGTHYRWYVRRKPTYTQWCEHSNLTVAVEQESAGTPSTLVVDTGGLRPELWPSQPPIVVLPSDVARYIRTAHQMGWQPDSGGKPFLLSASEVACADDE